MPSSSFAVILDHLCGSDCRGHKRKTIREPEDECLKEIPLLFSFESYQGRRNSTFIFKMRKHVLIYFIKKVLRIEVKHLPKL